jgi:creatinine amidohydrolase
MNTDASRKLTPLCLADEATFWPWRTWTDFARLSAAEKQGTTVIVPIAGMADWGLGHPLDAEELVLMAVLQAAVGQRPAGFAPLVIPPLRFVLGPDAGCAFAVDPPTGHAFLREVAASINAAGFRRLILFNASPWNEELCAAASRDLRIEYGLQIFRINLSAIELDFHPARSQSRRRVQTLVTALTGRAPETTDAAAPARPLWADERVTPLPGPAASVATAATEGASILAAAAARVSALFGEIAAHPPLARDGALLVMTPP